MRSLPFLFLVLVLAAACGPKSSGTTTAHVDNGGGGGGGGPVYAALFEEGRSWRFTVESKDSYWDDQDPNADADGNVTATATRQATCKVTRTGEYEGAKLAFIECDGLAGDDGSQDPLSGLWVSDAVGAYHVNGAPMPEPGAAPDRTYQSFVMPVVPVEKTESEQPEEGAISTTISQNGDEWCWSFSAAMGDESWESLCFGPGGVTEGTFGWAGGSVHEVTFRAQ